MLWMSSFGVLSFGVADRGPVDVGNLHAEVSATG